jgi:hypothetical protein
MALPNNQFDMNAMMQMFSNPNLFNANIAGGSNALGNINLGGGDMFGSAPSASLFSSAPTDMFGNQQNLMTVGAPSAGGGMFDGLSDFFDSETFNTIGQGIGAATDLFSIYAGLKGLGFAEDRNDMMKTNMNNQANLTNERLRTRQGTRLRSQGITGDENAKMVAEFMAKNSVSGA